MIAAHPFNITNYTKDKDCETARDSWEWSHAVVIVLNFHRLYPFPNISIFHHLSLLLASEI